MSTTDSSHAGAPATLAGQRRVRVHHLSQAKARGEQIVMLTAYDAVTARILDEAGTDVLLVGDSMGNVMLGHGSTLPVTLEEMLVATRSVARATDRALVLADLPFGSYEAGPEQALASAVSLVKAGAHAVKIEGGAVRAASVRLITEAGIPVFGHIGFTPQSVNALGGYRVQGRGEGAADALVADALALTEAGAVAFIVEMVPESVGARITHECPVPVIGIGAGARCDGQVLVWTDMAGMSQWSPRFAARFGQVGQALREAAQSYGEAVREGSFPAQEHWFDS
ncbi:MAG: 3-methyl-2-oxobutanoate hydroxymethyltransferase [Actinomyces sp.]|uniref:3-methyl-2-oxobutanoate hydroxymethyltransferase n=1 Tax=Actinomyces sp. TaxID=29317 RepID=UPI0026DD3035|nr:3-methyl-2-oxobutanoate hydroxymethyltransferase [Actinomyces sp.]MDO4242575.1 3-methyl-2-oxobutanoate hydroxymethyltransferase [Actinomyces sp.]